VDAQISQMLVEHFNKAKLFEGIQLLNVDNDLDTNNDEMEKLCTQGVDLVILGKLKHFYGYQSQGAMTAASVMFGALGVLTEAIANPKTVGGVVEYSDVKVVDVKNKKVLWEGTVTHGFEEEDVFYDGPNVYALRALQKANNQFVQDLNNVLEARKAE
jgi:hypothetical protein